MQSKITLKGNKKDSYILEIQDGRYQNELQITHEELQRLQIIINNKLK